MIKILSISFQLISTLGHLSLQVGDFQGPNMVWPHKEQSSKTAQLPMSEVHLPWWNNMPKIEINQS